MVDYNNNNAGNFFQIVKNGTTSPLVDGLVCLGILAFFTIVSLGYSFVAPSPSAEPKNVVQQSTYTQQSSTEVEQSAKSDQGEKTKDENAATAGDNMRTDLSLGGLDVGISTDEMHKALGQEKSSQPAQDIPGFVHDFYNGLSVGVKDGQVTTLVSDGANVQTRKGIHQGSSLAEVMSAYGAHYTKQEYNGLILYEYEFFAANGEKGILRFAIKPQNDQVDYISARLPEKTAVALQAKGR